MSAQRRMDDRARPAALLAAHRERLRALSDERGRILAAQSDVLRGYVAAGLPLPGVARQQAASVHARQLGPGGARGQAPAAAAPAAAGGAPDAKGRQPLGVDALVQQLVGEENAATAALEALKQARGRSSSAWRASTGTPMCIDACMQPMHLKRQRARREP